MEVNHVVVVVAKYIVAVSRKFFFHLCLTCDGDNTTKICVFTHAGNDTGG